ncbi:hypothetical protein VOLCADRAFT_108270 [Volvox carteri f. nagariensis]|uniref:Cation-transporting ATPase n=1 Tax=Volvox carteri f. nagariensis TaxID=3068 RepID=D8UJ77_VOLCA|nr:uncharacterized protein VOLCADRAFT_108270 [Volvox carteri f. nagariensis]EFJ40236.1 hypothetical protein VOLCADRAFT_108270 [Volvox carteri f. nagariensis]|eukprot:XP_002958716.1 hypothetical protein VOLCADRAFT_108270 [Volvox carteri f. nagariensis]
MDLERDKQTPAVQNIVPFEVEGGVAKGVGQPQQELQQPQPPKRQAGRKGKLLDVFTYEHDKDIASFEGFRSPWWKKLLYYLVGVLTAGFSFLLCKWSPRLHIFLSLSPCALKDAQYVRVRLVDGRADLERAQDVAMSEPQYDSHPTLTADEESGRGGLLLQWKVQKMHKLMEHRCTRYFYTDGSPTGGGLSGPTFTAVPAVPKGFNEQLRAAAQTLATTGSAATAELEQEWDLGERQLRYGKNEMAIPVKSIPMLVFHEMWHPFYVFQYFSILIWVVGDNYYSYAVCIFVITWFSIISAAVEAHNNMKRLAEIAHFECEVDVIRSGQVVRLPSSCLVPGDLVVVGPGTLPCDMVLLRGECIVDENMLTGESVPVRKVSYSPVADGLSYEPEKCPACTLFGGTVVAQARAPRHQKAVAMVCRTRFYSAKGQLLRSILFPREHEESFISDSLKFICGMLTLCLALYIWAAVVLAHMGASPDRIVVRFFDMITIAVPPALPACLTIATVLSIGRLRKKGIYVTSPDRITLAGQLDVICFDKTGTLTEQGLDLQGIVPIVEGRLHAMVQSVSLLPLQLVELLASCHGLARMGEALVGDPLDQKLFLATHWDLVDDRPSADVALDSENRISGGGAAAERVDDGVDGAVGQEGDGGAAARAAVDAAEATGTSDGVHTYVRPPGAALAYAIVKRFEFSAALQRNLVVVRAPDGSVAVFAKGSPEAIRSLVDPVSVPPDFDVLLGELTREGLRVLALAVGDASGVPAAQLLGWTQAETEAGVGLRMVGLAVMANPLREDTSDVIGQLQHASIRTVMVTGDHLRTAVSVAHKCAILPNHRPILLVDAADAIMAPQPPPSQPLPRGAQRTDTTPTAATAVPTAAAATGTLLSPAAMEAKTGTGPAAPLDIRRTWTPAPYGGNPTGPGPAGEPTPLGDPSVATGGSWGAAMLAEGDVRQVTPASPSAADELTSSAGASPQCIQLDVDKQADTLATDSGKTDAHQHANGHHHRPAQTPPADGAVAKAVLRLSVLDVDGNVTETATVGSGGSSCTAMVSELMARLVTGELECAVTGKGFNCLLAAPQAQPHQGAVPLLLPVLQHAAVFARMSPDNKRDLMLLLGNGIDGAPEGCPHLSLRAGFCGDGANDCGALKAAHVGVSLCEAEASVAAPMTSKAQTIASMITVVAEGRCTLMATYQIFQFIIVYALVQAFETNLMYTYALNLGDYQYLIEDLFFTTVLAALMGMTAPRSKLSRRRPLQRVMSLPLMLSTVAQCGVVVLFQLASLWMLQARPGYIAFKGGPDLHDTVAPENTVTYIVALAQFVVTALVFNKGMPHRSPIWTNYWLVAALLAQTAFVLYTLFVADKFNRDVQDMVDMNGVVNMAFRWELFGLLVGMGAVAFAAEYTCMGLNKLMDWLLLSRLKIGTAQGIGTADLGTVTAIVAPCLVVAEYCRLQRYSHYRPRRPNDILGFVHVLAVHALVHLRGVVVKHIGVRQVAPVAEWAAPWKL